MDTKYVIYAAFTDSGNNDAFVMNISEGQKLNILKFVQGGGTMLIVTDEEDDDHTIINLNKAFRVDIREQKEDK